MKHFKTLVSTALLFGLVACQSSPIGQTAPISDPISERTAQEYRLGASDQLRITVFGEPELSGEYLIDGTGVVSLPLVGDINALNLSVREFQNKLEARYADGYLREPRVNAEVMNYRPFYILGEVRTPGEYPYSNGLTILNAVATAGGFTYRANENVILIKSANDSEEYRVKLDPGAKVLPGDTIRVVERFF